MSIKMMGIYGGFFAGMLCLALFATGVFQQGILPRLSHSSKSETESVAGSEAAPKPPTPAAEALKKTGAASDAVKTTETQPIPEPPPGAAAVEQTKAKAAAPERSPQVARLARLYEGMRPKEAAGVLEKLERPLAVQVLAEIKERQAAKILGVMNPTVAADLTRLMGQGEEKTKP